MSSILDGHQQFGTTTTSDQPGGDWNLRIPLFDLFSSLCRFFFSTGGVMLAVVVVDQPHWWVVGSLSLHKSCAFSARRGAAGERPSHLCCAAQQPGPKLRGLGSRGCHRQAEPHLLGGWLAVANSVQSDNMVANAGDGGCGRHICR